MLNRLKAFAKRASRWVPRQAKSWVVTAIVLLAFVVGYSLRGDGHAAHSPAQPHDNTAASDSQQWYTCAMHPEVRMPNPDDKCPICFMSLIPVVSPGGGDSLGPREISLSTEAQALIDVQTVPVTRRFIEHRVDMVGKIEYDETRLAEITAYAGGRLDRLFVDYTGITVNQGDHLAEIYSPDLLVAQQELIGATRAMQRLSADVGGASHHAAEAVAASARDRLRLLGMTTAQIESIEAGGAPGDHVTLYSPIGGVVIVKHAKQGTYVKEGDRIYTIADLSEVWVILEAYESDLAWLRYGQAVRFTTESFGDDTFEGRIVFIDPILDPRKRTVRVRVNVPNPDGRLRPGMFVRGSARATIAEAGRVLAPELAGKWVSPMHPQIVRDGPGKCPICGMDLVPAEELGYVTTDPTNSRPPLVVPDSAVLRTGRRGIVYVKTTDDPEPRFEGREVELGSRGDGFFIIRSGLEEGELVVTRGNFQIDSALQIQAKASMMNPRGGPTATGHVHPGAESPATSDGHDHE